MSQVNPYLVFNGSCLEAFRLYQTLFGGEIESIRAEDMGMESPFPAEWPEPVMHATLTFGDRVIMGSDAPAGYYATPQGFSVAFITDSADDAERVWNGLLDGANVTMPLAPTDWSPMFGMLTDRFGTPWTINTNPPS
jgi:PhnB protein